jgi:hypothetical protein
MKTYKVTITETLEKTVEIKANSQREAEMAAQTNWKNSEYILDADNFTGVKFSARQNKEIER